MNLRRWTYLPVAAAVTALALYPPLAGGFLAQQAANYLIYGLLAFSVALIISHARLFNIGIGATFGVGAYAVALLTQLDVNNPVLLYLGAIAAGFAMSIVFGIYSIVASGIEYMMLTFLTTIAMSQMPNLEPKLTGGDNGLIVKGGVEISFGLNPLAGNDFYFFVLGVAVACTVVCWFVLSSQAGKAVRAIGRNPVRAAAMGYQVGQYRVALTLLSGFVASTAGWLYALQNSFVSQDLLGPANSINGLVYALVGGVDYILGPFAGGAGFRYLTENVSRHSTQSSLYIGVALLLVVYLMPNGVLGVLRSTAWRVWLRRRVGMLQPAQPADRAERGSTTVSDDQRPS